MKGTSPHHHINLGCLLAAISIIICPATANQTVDSIEFNLVEKCKATCIDKDRTEETGELCTLCIDNILPMQYEEYDTGMPSFHSGSDYQTGDEGRLFLCDFGKYSICLK